ncbi:MAG TPA: hypothetical protein PLP17_16815 [Oligoflexia bacterium]|nr:hypothetical protein [Oligoflexia bacterium]
MNVANSLIQLTANYRPDTAQAQFEIAKSLWWNPPLTQFQRPLLPAKEQAELEEKRNSYQEFLASELRTILDTKRSQTLLISNGQLSKVEKLSDFDMVRVRLATGLQLKSVGDKILSAEKAVYYVTMMPFQRNAQEEPEVFVVDVQVRHPDEPL